MSSSNKTPKADRLPSLRVYTSGLSKMSPEQQKRIIDAKHARSAAIATLPDKGMLGPSAKNKYLWVGTNLEEKVKNQGMSFSFSPAIVDIESHADGFLKRPHHLVHGRSRNPARTTPQKTNWKRARPSRDGRISP